jgi:DNA-binding response OmpR family regulator
MATYEESVPPKAKESTLPPARRKVMVVDDSTLILATTREYLAECGFEVRTAASLAEFERHTRGWAPDIILTDESMPEVSGAALCAYLKNRAETAHVLVILFSSLPDAKLEELAARCGADGYCSKRSGMQHLGERIETLCAEVVW